MVPFWESVPNADYIYIMWFMLILFTLPLSLCMLVCMVRRHASAGMRIWRKLRRLVATKRKYPWAVAHREPGEREVYL